MGNLKIPALVLVGVLLLHGASGPAHHLGPDADIMNTSGHPSHSAYPAETATPSELMARDKGASYPSTNYLATLLALFAAIFWLLPRAVMGFCNLLRQTCYSLVAPCNLRRPALPLLQVLRL